MSKIKEVTITVRIRGRFDSDYISWFKNTDSYKRRVYHHGPITNEDGIIDYGDGPFNVDNLDEDINVIRFVDALIMEGHLNLMEETQDEPKVFRE
tara:strand:- start:1053 stop:1337 length:285 start_codon:yes stop_codon:yes gene_type:complete